MKALRTGVACLIILPAGMQAGCSANFLPASFVNELRVIAVTSSPPEAVPGEEVTLTPEVVDPSGEVATPDGFVSTWWRCPDTDSDALGDFVQCTNAADRTDVGTGVPYVDTVPADLFGPLPDPAAPPATALPTDKLLGAILGYWRVIGLTTAAGDRSVDAFKRIPVYLPVRLGDVDPRLASLDSHIDENGTDLGANTNPTLSGILIHEDTVDGATTTTLSKDKTYFLSPVYDERTLQDYISLKVDLDGLDLSNPASLKAVPIDDMIKRFQKVQRCEIPTFSWFVTAGSFRRDTTIDEGIVQRVYDPRGVDCPPVEGDARAPEAQYTPPTGATEDPEDVLPADGVVHAWVVMRDGRGGTAVRSFDFNVE